MPNFDQRSLIAWFAQYRRLLPWRENPTPYAVWVSEIMLQQTQVSVVIPYFERWMKRFPSLQVLAKAEIEEVLKLWEGLGYYSRAKNLHRGAQVVCSMGGEIPQEAAELAKIPGLGPYTVSAIRAFAFHQKTAAVDANVLRVLSRYFAIQEDVGRLSTQVRLRELADKILPSKEPWIMAEALIELGALVCKKKPLCSQCPLKDSCKANQQGITDALPIKAKRVPTTQLYRAIPVLIRDGSLLVRRVPDGEVMGGLHEFPYFETSSEGLSSGELVELIKSQLKLSATPLQKLASLSHGFTRYSARLDPLLLKCKTNQTPEGYFWADRQILNELAFSSGHRRLLEQIQQFLVEIS